jgi:predicted NUDIX family phosphoesterase
MELEERVASIEARADSVRSLLRYASRAFVMEFAGTPKSGKSTSVEAIRHFFSRHGFRVHVLSERAAVCPIPMKGHLFFNTWCAASMLAELLANVETETDLIIVDRGLFDALGWLSMQKRRGELSAEEASTVEAFFLLERWRILIDLVVVMRVSADEAIIRENAPRITQKGGSIMNPDVLAAINDSVAVASNLYGKIFAAFIEHPTTGQTPRESNVMLASKVLDCLSAFLNPEVLVVPHTNLQALPLLNGGSFGEGAVKKVFECITSHGHFLKRADAEVQRDYVQIIPCGVLRYEKQVFVFQRKETDPKYRLYGKRTIWQGCHALKQTGIPLTELLKNALGERISRELFLSRSFPTEAVGYCWDRDDETSSHHFGVIYEITIDNPDTAVDLKKKQFRKRRGHDLSGQFVDVQQLTANRSELNLESWSHTILKDLLEKE